MAASRQSSETTWPCPSRHSNSARVFYQFLSQFALNQLERERIHSAYFICHSLLLRKIRARTQTGSWTQGHHSASLLSGWLSLVCSATFLFFKRYYYFYCVFDGRYVHMNASAHRGWRCGIFLLLDLKAVVSCLVWVLGIKLGSSE